MKISRKKRPRSFGSLELGLADALFEGAVVADELGSLINDREVDAWALGATTQSNDEVSEEALDSEHDLDSPHPDDYGLY